ncbi:alpha/beta hydrolase [Streptomyces sp. P38-E01]|uniref:Alpha/beta hydrolase n=1 Tax=Streptomyces tardus TaxID=2780544 RepID=A0A949N7B5_9ACTN|nr:alpha/beta hydrolase [Streptomyces tardus]MBU7597306.1 alpha/beta hydrolase [Streptomyces tardus]
MLRQHCASANAEHRALLLHGLGSSTRSWDTFLAHRPPSLEVWTAALPWRAGGPQAVPEADETDWIRESIRQIPGGPDIVVAHSYASVLLLTLLAETVARGADPREEFGISGAVLVSPFFREQTDDFSWAELPAFLDRLRLGAGEGIRLLSRKPLDSDLLSEMAEHSCAQLGPHWVVRYLNTYLRTPFLPVELVGLPVQIVIGDRDPIAPPTEGELLAGRLGNASIERIEGSGHTPMAEHPERFSLAVQQFLTTLSAGHTPAAVN